MNSWRSNLFLIVELIELLGSLILFEEICLECICNYWNILVVTGIGSWKSVFELACIYNWMTPWISVLMD